jgi:hypothetical protein
MTRFLGIEKPNRSILLLEDNRIPCNISTFCTSTTCFGRNATACCKSGESNEGRTARDAGEDVM